MTAARPGPPPASAAVPGAPAGQGMGEAPGVSPGLSGRPGLEADHLPGVRAGDAGGGLQDGAGVLAVPAEEVVKEPGGGAGVTLGLS